MEANNTVAMGTTRCRARHLCVSVLESPWNPFDITKECSIHTQVRWFLWRSSLQVLTRTGPTCAPTARRWGAVLKCSTTAVVLEPNYQTTDTLRVTHGSCCIYAGCTGTQCQDKQRGYWRKKKEMSKWREIRCVHLSEIYVSHTQLKLIASFF